MKILLYVHASENCVILLKSIDENLRAYKVRDIRFNIKKVADKDKKRIIERGITILPAAMIGDKLITGVDKILAALDEDADYEEYEKKPTRRRKPPTDYESFIEQDIRKVGENDTDKSDQDGVEDDISRRAQQYNAARNAARSTAEKQWSKPIDNQIPEFQLPPSARKQTEEVAYNTPMNQQSEEFLEPEDILGRQQGNIDHDEFAYEKQREADLLQDANY